MLPRIRNAPLLVVVLTLALLTTTIATTSATTEAKAVKQQSDQTDCTLWATKYGPQWQSKPQCHTGVSTDECCVHYDLTYINVMLLQRGGCDVPNSVFLTGLFKTYCTGAGSAGGGGGGGGGSGRGAAPVTQLPFTQGPVSAVTHSGSNPSSCQTCSCPECRSCVNDCESPCAGSSCNEPMRCGTNPCNQPCQTSSCGSSCSSCSNYPTCGGTNCHCTETQCFCNGTPCNNYCNGVQCITMCEGYPCSNNNNGNTNGNNNGNNNGVNNGNDNGNSGNAGNDDGTSGTDSNNNSGVLGSDGVCLHGDGHVLLQDGTTKAVADLRINDKVQVSHNTYSAVFMFTHQDAYLRTAFVKLSAVNHTLTVTPSHFVHTSDGTVQAGSVRVGDHLLLADKSRAVVADVKSVVSTGVYNPQTLHGDIVVDGFLVSTYTKAVDSAVAHSMLLPLRALHRICGLHLSSLF